MDTDNVPRGNHFRLSAVLALMVFFGSCSHKSGDPAQSDPAASSNKSRPTSVSENLRDKSLAVFQVELLDLAFQAASAIPKEPFIKDRCRQLETVADTCLKLDQPVRAVRIADRIDNWRRGYCYAKTAYYLAERGHPEEHVEKSLKLAEQIAELDHGQKWRSDRIRAKIAQTHMLLSKTRQAEKIRMDLEDSEAGKLLETGVIAGDDASFEDLVSQLDAAIALFHFEITQDALNAYTRLFDQYYDNPKRRNLAEEKIKSSWQRLPVPIRLELLMKLAGFSLDHEDPEKALNLAQEAQGMLKDYQWHIQDYIPLLSKLIVLRFQAGDAEKAQMDADTLQALYDEKGKGITDIYRTETLLPLAEAYSFMNDTKSALQVYQKAVQAAISNPNTKPRAEDLTAICCSMALSATEPDASFWVQLRNIIHGLDPS